MKLEKVCLVLIWVHGGKPEASLNCSCTELFCHMTPRQPLGTLVLGWQELRNSYCLSDSEA